MYLQVNFASILELELTRCAVLQENFRFDADLDCHGLESRLCKLGRPRAQSDAYLFVVSFQSGRAVDRIAE